MNRREKSRESQKGSERCFQFALFAILSDPVRLLSVLTYGLVTMALAIGAAAKDISFRGLAPNQRIHVNYAMKGCFLFDRFEFDFVRTPALTGTVTHIDFERVSPDDVVFKKNVLGKAVLAEDEVAGLDRLMKFYRRKFSTFSSRIDEISVDHFGAKGKISNESFMDSTESADELESVTTFMDLAGKVSEKYRSEKN